MSSSGGDNDERNDSHSSTSPGDREGSGSGEDDTNTGLTKFLGKEMRLRSTSNNKLDVAAINDTFHFLLQGQQSGNHIRILCVDYQWNLTPCGLIEVHADVTLAVAKKEGAKSGDLRANARLFDIIDDGNVQRCHRFDDCAGGEPVRRAQRERSTQST